MCSSDLVELPASDIVILEGVGSAARELREHAQLTIFIDIDDAEGVKRVRTRDGLEVAAHMQSWIHHQQKYFESDETRTSCDIFIASNV